MRIARQRLHGTEFEECDAILGHSHPHHTPFASFQLKKELGNVKLMKVKLQTHDLTETLTWTKTENHDQTQKETEIQT